MDKEGIGEAVVNHLVIIRNDVLVKLFGGRGGGIVVAELGGHDDGG